MPVYNGEKYLSFAVNSVLEQTYTNYELLIINDCSTDNTGYILKRYENADKRIRVHNNKVRLGVAKSLNFAINLSGGTLIARIDSDDIWHKDKLQKQVNYFASNPSVFLLGTAKTVIDEYGNRINTKEKQFFSYKDIKAQIIKNNLFCHSSVIFRKSIIKDVGYYNEDFRNTEDYEYWLRIIAKIKGEILPEALVYYRIHKDMASLKRRKQQFMYVIKAKLNAIFLYNYSIIYLIYIIKDIWPLLVPDCIIRLKKFIYRKKESPAGNGN